MKPKDWTIPTTIEPDGSYVIEPLSNRRVRVTFRALGLFGRGNVEREVVAPKGKGKAWRLGPWTLRFWVHHTGSHRAIAKKREDKIREDILAAVTAWAKTHPRTLMLADRRHWREAMAYKARKIREATAELKKLQTDLRTARWMVRNEDRLVYS